MSLDQDNRWLNRHTKPQIQLNKIPVRPIWSQETNYTIHFLRPTEVKVVPVRAVNAYTGSRGTAPLILHLGTR